jgi:hypothetical protein
MHEYEILKDRQTDRQAGRQCTSGVGENASRCGNATELFVQRGQTDRQAGRHAGRQDRQDRQDKTRQTDRQTYIQTDRQTDRTRPWYTNDIGENAGRDRHAT